MITTKHCEYTELTKEGGEKVSLTYCGSIVPKASAMKFIEFMYSNFPVLTVILCTDCCKHIEQLTSTKAPF